MSKVYFVKMNEMQQGFYDSYRDYFRLAELSGYATCWLDEVDPASNNTYILTPLNGSWHNGFGKKPKARIILHDLEWRLQERGHKWVKADFQIPPGVSEVWASDKWYAEFTGARYVPLGSHPGLVGDEAPAAERYDCAVLACQSQDGGRQHIFDTLLKSGLTLAPNAWDPARDSILKSSAVMLHTHQWRNVRTIAPLRYAIAAAYSLPLISEPVESADIFADTVLFCEAPFLPAYLDVLLSRHDDLLEEHGKLLNRLLCHDYSFKHNIEVAL